MKILLAYASNDGQTRKISEWIGEWFRERHHEVRLYDVETAVPVPSIGEFGAVILAGSVHAGKHQVALLRFVVNHLVTIQPLPCLFLSVSWLASHVNVDSMEKVEDTITGFLEETGLHPAMVVPVAGALKYTRYNFFFKEMARLVASQIDGPTDTSRDHEMTDWPALAEHSNEFLVRYVLAEPASLPTQPMHGRAQ